MKIKTSWYDMNLVHACQKDLRIICRNVNAHKLNVIIILVKNNPIETGFEVRNDNTPCYFCQYSSY